MYVCMYVCMHVWMYVCIYIYIYVCMYVCMDVYIYICMNVCMYVCINIYIPPVVVAVEEDINGLGVLLLLSLELSMKMQFSPFYIY